MPTDHYDLIVIGSGPGGASLAQRLAPTGKRILMLERGGYLPRSRKNWDAGTVFVDAAYQATETWYGGDGTEFRPGLHYFVGGNSKVYGSALLRLRERDFGELQHVDGISPAWPLGYDVFEPYYGQASDAPASRASALRAALRIRQATSRPLMWSATRSALAMMVSVGFTAPIEGKKLASVT